MPTETMKRRVRVVVDSDPLNPRVDYDNAGRMICWHSNYNLGDDHNYDRDNFERELAFEACEGLEDEVWRLENEVWEKLVDRAGRNGNSDIWEYASRLVDAKVAKLVDKAVSDGYIFSPLYLMDHSGISMSTGSFSCPWDSGQVGYIICDNETIQREWGGDRDLAEKCLEAEVEVYDLYIRGAVYGFIVEELEESTCPYCEHWEHVDSCWGFFGYDPRTNGMAEHLGDEELVRMACDATVEYPH
jgi:hypothetical protein